jgi:hypothetical protein
LDIYHHLENTKAYLKLSSSANIYELDLLAGGVTFSQTFTEKTYKTKTLHSQGDLVEEGTIKKANPATFSFGVPLLKDDDFDVPIFNTLVDLTNNTLQTFTLWFIEQSKAFCLETCVFESGSFQFQKNTPISIRLNGTAAKLTAADNNGTEVVNSAGTVNFTHIASTISSFPTFVAGNIQSRTSPKTFLPLNKVLSHRSSTDGLSSNQYLTTANSEENLMAASMELQNRVEWTKYRTVHGGIDTTNRSNIEYPTSFTLKSRALAGNSKWVIPTAAASEAATNFSNTVGQGANQEFYENSAWITGGFSNQSNVDYGVIFKASSGVNVTSRVSPGPFYTMDMDWRLASNSSSISSLLTYITA